MKSESVTRKPASRQAFTFTPLATKEAHAQSFKGPGALMSAPYFDDFASHGLAPAVALKHRIQIERIATQQARNEMHTRETTIDRQSVVTGKRVSLSVDLRSPRTIQ